MCFKGPACDGHYGMFMNNKLCDNCPVSDECEKETQEFDMEEQYYD